MDATAFAFPSDVFDAVVSIEAAQPRLDLAVLRQLPSKTIILGVLDLADGAVETPETVAERIRAALPYAAAERIVVAPDCGLKYLSREVAFAKMRAMVEGANIVRQEIGWQKSVRSEIMQQAIKKN